MTRRTAVLAVLLAGAALLATTPATWVRASTSTAVRERVDVLATGLTAAPGVSAAGLLVVAAGLALAMARHWGAIVAAAGVVGGGVLAVASASAVVGDPDRVATAAARAVSGVGVLDGDAVVTPALWAAVVLGVLVVLLGFVVGAVSRGWQAGTLRHDAGRIDARRPGTGVPDVAPPDGARRDGAQPDPAPAGADEDPATGGALGDPASWDALSRGEDPTA